MTTTTQAESEPTIQRLNWLKFDRFYLGVYERHCGEPLSEVVVRLAETLEGLEDAREINIGFIRHGDESVGGACGLLATELFLTAIGPDLLREAIQRFGGIVREAARIQKTVADLVWFGMDGATTEVEIRQLKKELEALRVLKAEWLP